MRAISTIVKSTFCFLTTIALISAAINSNGQKGVLRTLSAETQGAGDLNVVVGANEAQSDDYVQGPVKNGAVPSDKPLKDGSPITIGETPRVISGNVSSCIGILNFWDLALSLPIYYDWAGFERGLSDAGIGDLEISNKLRQPPIGNILYQSYFLAITAPVGTTGHGLFPRSPIYLEDKADAQDTNPAKNFYSYDNPVIKAMLLWTLDFSQSRSKIPLSLDLNIGGALSTDWEKRNMALGNFAIEYSPAQFITLFAEFSAEVRWSSFSRGINMLRDPLYVSPGIRITAPAGLYMYLAGDFSLSSTAADARNNWSRDYGGDHYEYSTGPTPAFGVHFGLGWNGFLTKQDRDHDGIPDDIDKCPDDPEDIDGFEDSDGCPDPDNDHDSICDPWVSQQHLEAKYARICHGIDKCPNDAEDKDGFQDDDGCPDLDNDKDGIPDLKDQCPNAPEDFDGFEDKDGCPDYDNDKDGIPDSLDKCPNDAEDIDGFQDADGCPDIDNDNDGIPDLKDLCPNQPETFNGYKDDDGCPDTVPPPPKKKEPDFPRQQTFRTIKFQNNSPEMLLESYRPLDPVIKTLKEYPEIEIEVRVHTDGLGKADANMMLSQKRAESVRLYLITQGIDGTRIRAVGFGSSNPIADNRTAAGRNQNRRVEIARVK